MDWTLTEYEIAWLAYLVAFTVIYRAWIGIVSWLPGRLVRQTFKGLLAVLLLTPVASQHAAGWLTPAWLHFGYALILDESEQMGRSLLSFTIAGIVMLVALSLDAAWARYRRR